MPTTVFSDESLSFLGPQWINKEQQSPTSTFQLLYNVQQGGNSASRPCPQSPSSSSLSTWTESSNSPVRSPDTTTYDDSCNKFSTSDKPYLQIVEEPYDKFRFRYKTEMTGPHGPILGISSQQKSRHKTYPKVKLQNYKQQSPNEKVIIRCTLYTADEDVSKRIPHVHKLVSKFSNDDDEDDDDIHDIPVNPPSYTALFQHMTILFTKKEKQVDVLVNKKQNHIKRMFTDSRNVEIQNADSLRDIAVEEVSNMNFNVACLRFDALRDDGHGVYTAICPEVYSRPISNIKNAQFNELKICRVDKVMGTCDGNEEVFIFVEKVVKKNIKVRFYEEDENGIEVWSAYAQFTPDDVHHQYGIVFKTPPYRNRNITDNVEVYFQLERPSDKAVSEPRKFQYKPNTFYLQNLNRKRPRRDDGYSFPTTLHEFQAPPALIQSHDFVNPAMHDITDNVSISLDLMLQDILAMPGNAMNDGLPDLNVQPDNLGSITSSNMSATELLSNLPSADSEAILEVLGQGRMEELGSLYGEAQAVSEIMSVVSSTQDGVMVFDGLFKPKERNRPVLTAQPEMASSNRPVLRAQHEMASTLNYLPCGLGPGYIPEANYPRPDRVHLTEFNIVSVTEKCLQRLMEMQQGPNKLPEKRFHSCMLRLFMYTVDYSGDSVFHVLAASEDNNLSQTLKFLNALKMYDTENYVINKNNNRKETPLHIAASRGSPEMVDLLLDSGAQVDLKDLHSNTALHLAILRDDHALAIVRALLLRKPNLQIYNEDGFTALHLAVSQRKAAIISFLLMKSENYGEQEEIINLKDFKQGNTPLHIAVQRRFKDVVTLLLNFETRIDVNVTNFAGQVPLQFVLEETDLDTVDIQQQLLPLTQGFTEADIKKQEDVKEETDPDHEIVDVDEEDDGLSAYAREWSDLRLFDQVVIPQLCHLLDKNENWSRLLKRFNFTDDELDSFKIHWSPSLLAFKYIDKYRPDITADNIRDELLEMKLRCCAQYIDDMLLRQMGLE